jgi:hypothetical protein
MDDKVVQFPGENTREIRVKLRTDPIAVSDIHAAPRGKSKSVRQRYITEMKNKQIAEQKKKEFSVGRGEKALYQAADYIQGKFRKK